jgi:hypothetical protein
LRVAGIITTNIMDTNPQSPPGDEVPNDEVSNDYHQFTFEYLLDEAQEIEADVSPRERLCMLHTIVSSHSLVADSLTCR